MQILLTIIIVSVSIIAFYVTVLWFFHKASVRFKKMDEAIGNCEENEMKIVASETENNTINSRIIIKNDDTVPVHQQEMILEES